MPQVFIGLKSPNVQELNHAAVAFPQPETRSENCQVLSALAPVSCYAASPHQMLNDLHWAQSTYSTIGICLEHQLQTPRLVVIWANTALALARSQCAISRNRFMNCIVSFSTAMTCSSRFAVASSGAANGARQPQRSHRRGLAFTRLRSSDIGGITKKAEPPPTRGGNRDSETASANGGWHRRS